jgi:mannose-6-phosphate isomerase-like protein (cupin superfamily)
MHSRKDDLARGGIIVGAMTTPTAVVSAIDDLPQIWDGFAKLVRTGLGITAFGVQIMDLPPDYRTRSHDESDSGQQEMYVALHGSGAVICGEESLQLDPEHIVRVDAGIDRVLSSGAEGLRVLCVGGKPGAPYTPPEWTETD